MNNLLPPALLGILAPGFIIFLGFVVIFVKLRRRTALRLLAWPLTIDITAGTIAFLMHGGNTYTGGMAATSAAIFVAIGTSFARKAFGYIESGTYHPGWIRYRPDSLQ